MDVEEYKKLARNKTEAGDLTKQVRVVIKITKWQKQDAREGFKESFKPLISHFEKPEEEDKTEHLYTLNQKLIQNQLAITEGLKQNQKAITDGLEKINETNERLADIGEVAGFEAIDAPQPDSVVDTKPTTQTLPTAKFTKEDLDRYLMSKEAQDMLKINEYRKLPSDYFKEDVSTINKVIDDVNEDLEDTSRAIKNTAIFVRDPNGYVIAKPVSRKPHENTLNFINKFNVLSVYATNLSNIKYYKTKSGSGIFYFNNPHQLLDRLELLGGSILAGNNGVIPEFSQIAHLLNQMKVITKKQLNDLLRNYISIK